MQPIVFPHIPFDGSLASALFDLERVRGDFRTEQLADPLTLELRRLFQGLTSIMSARIEGNRTTVADVIAEARRVKGKRENAQDAVREILQLEEATEYIDRLVEQGPLRITHKLIRDVHQLSADGLEREGDPHPGSYRTTRVAISGAMHTPPDPATIQADMDQLLDFANQEVLLQQQLIQVAMVHHRFVWIHPFANGNGRVARLLTYAMLTNRGFTSTSDARPLNPTAVFGADRQAYYDNLALADNLSEDGALAWCSYMIQGLRDDLFSVTQLSDRLFVANEVFAPALNAAVAAGDVKESDADILYEVARRGKCKAGDLTDVLTGSASSRSHKLRRLVESNLLLKVRNPAGYGISLWQNQLTLYVVRRLDELGMLPSILKD